MWRGKCSLGTENFNLITTKHIVKYNIGVGTVPLEATHKQSILPECASDKHIFVFHSCIKDEFLVFSCQRKCKKEMLRIFFVSPHRVPAYCSGFMNKSLRRLSVLPGEACTKWFFGSQALGC